MPVCGARGESIVIKKCLEKQGGMRVIRLLVLCTMFVGGALSAAQANTTYSYTGSSFTSCSGTYTPPCSQYSVTGSFTVTLSPLELENLSDFAISPTDISSFAFFGAFGVALNNTNATSSSFRISTDANGNLTDWQIFLNLSQSNPNANSSIETYYLPEVFGSRPHPATITDDTQNCLSYVIEPIRGGFSCSSSELGFTHGPLGVWTSSYTPVPEPSMGILVGITGLIGVGGFLWRRSRNRCFFEALT